MSSNGTHAANSSPGELLASLRESFELLGRLLQSHQDYLSKIITEEIDPRLKARQGVSDIVQVAYLRVLENFNRATGSIFSVGSEEELRRWLREITLNALYQEYRDEGRQVRDFRKEQPIEAALAPDDDAPSPSSVYVRNERDGLLTDAINALPEVDRVLLRLREWHGWTYPALAGLIDGSETDKGRMSVLRRVTKIRFELGRDDTLSGLK